MKNAIFLLILLIFNIGCGKVTENFECFWRGGNCDSDGVSGNSSSSSATCSVDVSNLATGTAVTGTSDGGAVTYECAAGFKKNVASLTCQSNGSFDVTPGCFIEEWLVQLHGNAIQDVSGAAIDFTANEYTNEFTADKNGNIYAFGSTSGGSDAYIIKMNGDGKVVWRKIFDVALSGTEAEFVSAAGTDRFRAATNDENNNSYFTIETTGNFAGTNAGGTDCGVGKINEDGDIQWLTQLEESDATIDNSDLSDFCGAIAIHKNTSTGNYDIYVGGRTLSQGFESGAQNPGTNDAFIAKLSGADGSISWVRQIRETAGNATALCTALATDSSGNIYCGGYVAVNSIDGEALTGVIDIFIVKYDSNGNKVASYQHGFAGKNSYINDIAIDSSNNVFAIGKTNGDLDGTNSGSNDGFILKIDSDLTDPAVINQVKTADVAGDATGDESFRNLQINSSGAPIVFGYTTGSVDGETNTGNIRHPLLLKFSSDLSSISWVKQYGEDTAAVGQINDASAGNIVQDYGEFLGSSLVINPDGSIYFGSVIEADGFGFSANTGGGGVKAGGDTSDDPWIMKIQESVGDLKAD